MHIDIDPAEIHKNKEAHIPVCADVRPALRILNSVLAETPLEPGLYAEWVKEVSAVRSEFPLSFPASDEVIMPQWAIQQLYEETEGKAVVTTGVGQHQMWAAQYYKFAEPRRWVTSGGLGSMGFGLPSGEQRGPPLTCPAVPCSGRRAAAPAASACPNACVWVCWPAAAPPPTPEPPSNK